MLTLFMSSVHPWLYGRDVIVKYYINPLSAKTLSEKLVFSLSKF